MGEEYILNNASLTGSNGISTNFVLQQEFILQVTLRTIALFHTSDILISLGTDCFSSTFPDYLPNGGLTVVVEQNKHLAPLYILLHHKNKAKNGCWCHAN